MGKQEEAGRCTYLAFARIIAKSIQFLATKRSAFSRGCSIQHSALNIQNKEIRMPFYSFYKEVHQ